MGFRLVDRVRRGTTVLAVLVALLGAVAVGTGLFARDALATFSRSEREATTARSLGALGREQYIDELHRARGVGGPHAPAEPWAERIARASAMLAPSLDAAGKARLQRIGSLSRGLSQVLSERVAKAARAKDDPTLDDDEHAAQAIVEKLVTDTDHLARDFDLRRQEAEAVAFQASRLSVFLGGLFSGLGIIFAWLVGRRLVGEVTAPLGLLLRVTDRIRSGERDARVGPLDAEELDRVGKGLDTMLDEVGAADAKVLAAERLAVLGRVTATVAHEMNNPLAVLRGYVTTLRDGAADDELRRELAIVDEEAAACQRIVDDLRVASHVPVLRKEQVDPAKLAEEVAARRKMGTRLVVDVAPDDITADAVRLRQVVENLIDNAEQVTKGAGHLVLRGVRNGANYELSLEDDGPGVDDAEAERIFEPFVSGREGGSGLGLSVCKAIANAHGGSIAVQRGRRGGARFVVSLPL